MKKFLQASFFLCFPFLLNSQSVTDAAVQISAVAQSSPAQISLSWVGNGTTTQYQVFRKLKTVNFWGGALATLPGSTNSYTDNTAQVGDNYEYKIVRSGSGYSGYGYINSGIEVPEGHYRGKLILIVDSTMMLPLASEIKRYIEDVEGDGWEVIRHDVLRTGSVYLVKDLIVADYAVDSAEIKAVFLLGHVPVPYSGNINPDGHSDHLGAWPADCYYGDVDGLWTDLNVTSTTASPARTQNVPGDGKFDQSVIPSDLELQVGRADFSNLPSFTQTEQVLLKNYLDKDHAYRKKIFVPLKQAVVDDNFGYFGGEAFAASAYKNFGPLVGPANVTSADYFTSMNGTSYQWSYGCGGGWYQGASGIGNTGAFATSSLQGVFTMLFGSYFGDWDSQDNFLRAPLAQGMVLTNVWSGRPHYQFHHMGLGENIGYSLIITQNNPGVYFGSVTGITGRWVHNALMGDPTLRNDVVAPVSNVIATKAGYNCNISWSASTQSNIVGYNLYVKNDSNTHYTKLNQFPISGTTYTDNCLLYKGTYTYMVRTLVLETNNSGSYYNMSEGIADTAYNSSTIKTYASFTSTLNAVTVSFSNTSINGTGSAWNFGDGGTSTATSPVQTYTSNGTYTVMLVSFNGCASDTAWEEISISEVSIDELSSIDGIHLYPNPASTELFLESSGDAAFQLQIRDLQGRVVLQSDSVRNGDQVYLSDLPKGLYFVELRNGNESRTMKLVVQ